MPANEFAPEVPGERKANYPIVLLLLNRWSPRSMTAEPLPDHELLPLFEAARWAPSSFNGQPWRFIVARRDDPEQFARFLDLLVPGNQAWAKNAAALVVIVSRTRFEHNEKPAITHAFDTGAAWENLALEAAHRGLVAHAMQGFDYARAKAGLSVPDEFEVQAMVAIGRRAPAEHLPENLRAKEQMNSRRPLTEIVFNGAFGKTVPGLP